MKTEKSISIQCLIKQVFKDIIKKYRGESVNTLIDNKKIDKNDNVSIKTLLTYSSGSLGNNIIYSLISSYLLIFLTDNFGVGAAAVGTLFLVARIIDAITDPIMGVIVDNTNTKLGKSRPYLFIVPIFVGLATIMCFSSPNLTYSNKIIWIYVAYIFWEYLLLLWTYHIGHYLQILQDPLKEKLRLLHLQEQLHMLVDL